MDITGTLTAEFSLRRGQVENVVKLIDDGNTIPFIARYRKEMTDSLDDQVLRELSERLEYLRGLDKRRAEVVKSIGEQEKLTPEIAAMLEAAKTMTEIDDIYRPFRPKRRTRATIARERGLEPLAAALLAQETDEAGILVLAQQYVSEEKGLPTAQDAVAGALDIVAEGISDNAALRKSIRECALREGVLESKKAKDEDSVYAMYYEYSEPVAKIPGHRILAVDRGEREEFLKVSLLLDEEKMLRLAAALFVKPRSRCAQLVRDAAKDAYERLIFPSIEREVRNELTDRAQEQAIRVFAMNLKQLLLQPPVRGHAVLGLDPAYRTGCKVAVVDATGKVLDKTVIYPTPPQSKIEEAKRTVGRLIEQYGVEVIAIGNGTASKETEIFTAGLLRELGRSVSYMVVSEAGASVYSASKLAAQEFPDYDVSLRSA
ncbi:MAG: Tex-like N-terminal domain-containing protein, partial [Clostridia bacterium]|nr:Tex-like N-terminal domain-containing protein [Clostridia bacterium]